MVFVIEISVEALGFEAEALVEQHGRVGRGNMERHVFPHARLNQRKNTLAREAVKRSDGQIRFKRRQFCNRRSAVSRR